MARVVEGFLLGTHYDLTFYLMNGNLYVRMKSALSRKKVKYSPRFKRTMQSAEELRRASKLASRIYRELSKEQKKRVAVLYKEMTGVAKIAFKYGKNETEAEREVREYLVREGVVKKEITAKKKVTLKEKEAKSIEVKEEEKKVVLIKRKRVDDQSTKLKRIKTVPTVFAIPGKYFSNRNFKTVYKNFSSPNRYGPTKKRISLFDG